MPKTTAKSAEIITMLNKQVANLNVLYVKIHHYHWYVQGSSFYELHAKFQELYEEATTHMDTVAERVLALGGKPLSTMKEYLETASIEEAKKGENSGQMIEQLLEDFRTLAGELKEGAEAADEQGDKGTSDMLMEICSSYEKHIWMLEAFLSE